MPAETGKAVLDVRGLAVTYDGVPALRDVSLQVVPGEVLAVLGPSGSGKSTLLHAVAGFRPASRGEIWLQGRLVAGRGRSEPPERRNVAVVFQHYALWPHLSALDTVGYPLRRRGANRADARRAASQLLELLGIAHLADRRPSELSGGEQQRVGLARALARQAALSLFDEPTAHLDTHVRELFLAELVSRQRASGAAALYASHDAAEALGLADRVALLANGRLVQVGSPQQVYSEPIDRFAAALTGPASVLSAPVRRCSESSGVAALGDADIPVSCPPDVATDAGLCRLLVRPGWASLGGPLPGRLTTVWFRGPHSDHLLETRWGSVLVREPGAPRVRVGEQVPWTLERTWLLRDAESAQPSTSAGPE